MLMNKYIYKVNLIVDGQWYRDLCLPNNNENSF